MICSINYSLIKAIACALCAAVLAACAGAKPIPARAMRVAVFPPVNLAGNAAPVHELRAALEAALRDAQVDIVDPAGVEEFLARHRVRYTGGLDRAAAIAAAAELGVQGVLISSVELYQAAAPPKLALSLRLVSAGEAPAILWIDSAAKSGDDSPGAFDLGVINDIGELQSRMLRGLAGSLAAWSAGGPHATACSRSKRFGPRQPFRSPLLDVSTTPSVAILPFLNETQRRSAGEIVGLELARQLEATGSVHVVEPGLVRDELLRYRIVMETGVSLDVARVVSELVHADLIVTGYVRDFEEAGGAPRVSFTVLLLDRANSEVLWQSTSYNRGDDGVFFFDAGKVQTSAGLLCRMARSVVEGIAR